MHVTYIAGCLGETRGKEDFDGRGYDGALENSVVKVERIRFEDKEMHLA